MTAIDPAELKGRKLGRVLTKLGHVTREQVHEALAIQKTRRVPIGQLLIELGYCSERDVSEGLAGQAGMAYVDLSKMEIPEEALAAIPSENAQTYQVVPIEFNPKSKRLKIALKSPDNFRAVDDLRLLMGFNVEAVVADAAAIDSLIQKHYSKTESVMDVVSGLAADDRFKALDKGGASIDLDAVLEAAEDNQVIKLLNLVLLQAIKDRASDIHFEPFENEFKMRYRIDGVLYEMVPPPKHLGPAITSRIKVMSHLDIAERRLPQDGRIELMVGGNPVDLRVAVLPTMWGESVVMRVLDRSNVELSLERIGFREDDLARFRKLIQKPNGIVIVTGPTGSGKTTTLYAALAELNDVETKILTAEDPVEYDIDGLCQCQMNEEVGLTFARALRSFLRQDPDIILVGEIRDLETAEVAINASLTGHLVFSTLHTNDTVTANTRLLDMGVEPFLVSSSISGVLAQRLVRKLCPDCKEEYKPEMIDVPADFQMQKGDKVYRAVGCRDCRHTGYRGRMGIFELLMINDELREMIVTRKSAGQMQEVARKKYGLQLMREDGWNKVRLGLTTIDEIVRVTQAVL